MPESLGPNAVLAHAEFVRRLAWHLVRDDAAADDVAQEALTRALIRPPLDGERPRPWLAGVVRNVVRRMGRDASRRSRRERVAARPEAAAGPDVLAARAETLRAVGEAVAALEEPFRSVIVMRHYDGLPPRVIAARLGVPVETVHSRLRRAHARLRERLDATERPEQGRWRAVLGSFVAEPKAWRGRPRGIGTAGVVGGAIAMAMKSKLTAVAAGLLLVALGGLAVSRGFLFGESGGGRASSSPPPQLGNGAELGAGPARPHLAGAPPRNADGQHTPTARGESVLTAETPSGLDVRGVVVNEEGKPVEGVTVFRISKGLAGLDDLRGPHATSDAAGRFALKMESSASAWVGAVKDGYLPAYVDGDAMPDPQSVRLPLVAGGEVRVRLESDDPEALLFSTVTLTAETGTEAWDFPAPGHDPRTSVWTELGPDHRAILRIGTKGPVRVTASGGGIFWVSDPAEVVLDRPEGDVTFRIVRSCAVRLRVTEADGRTPFALPFQVARLDSVTGKLLTGGSTTNPERTGVFDDVGYFWPGSYRMRVTAEGFAPFISEPFTLRRFGEELRLVAPLVPDSARMGGTVVLTVPVAARSGATWYLDAASPPGRGAPSLLLRRSGGAWYTPAGTQVLPSGEILVGESGWSEGARQLRILQVPPGSYEALVWDRGTWTCGYVPQLAVAAGSTANATVALVPGVRIRIRDLAGPATLARKLRLRAVGVEDLPAVEFQSASSAQTYGDYPPPPEVVLSPLPFDSVWASFDLPDGTRKEVEIKSKP